MPEKPGTLIIHCKDGEINMDAYGFVGSECKVQTDKLVKAINGKKISSQDKPENTINTSVTDTYGNI